jgi:hypothetical protein
MAVMLRQQTIPASNVVLSSSGAGNVVATGVNGSTINANTLGSTNIQGAIDEVWKRFDQIKVRTSDVTLMCSREVCWRCTGGYFSGRLGKAGMKVLRGMFEIDWARGFVKCWSNIDRDAALGAEPMCNAVANVPLECPYRTEHAVCQEGRECAGDAPDPE